MSYLAINGLFKTFDTTSVLKGLHLEVAKGEFVSLLGASGSGKTTILRCLAGLEKPDEKSGAIVLNGVELSHKNVFLPPEKRNLGLVFQNYAIWPHLNLFENVAFPLRVKKLGGSKEIAQRVENVLELVQLQNLSQRYGYQLSGGQQQRVALARALVMSPDLLLLDEPLSNLDAILREELGFQIRKLTRKLGLTTILVTHDQSEALSLSDRLILLNQGEIETQGRPEELYRNPPTEFTARFLSKAQEISDFQGTRQLFLPRNWNILEEGGGTSVTITSRIFLGSEYQYLAENSQYQSSIVFYSSRRFEQDEVVHLQYRREPADIVVQTMRQFKITRPAVHKHLNHLVEEGVVKKDGTTRAVRYAVLASEKTWKVRVHPGLQEDEVWDKYLMPELSDLSKNVHSICLYGFTEMMNNVIDHSEATEAIIELNISETSISIGIKDNGVGIFRKIQKALVLPDIKESLLHLSKGKFTTDPAKHTGEGIFFTSRAFEEFKISSDELEYVCISEDHDWLIQTLESGTVSGTNIHMKIDRICKNELDHIFKEYSDSEYSFNRTNVLVKLVKLTGEKYISRSQAKRLLLGLEKFKKVVLDFKEVSSVGQGFVDEVFRVFKNSHPEIEIEYVNTNENVEFMIQRGLSNSQPGPTNSC